MTNPDRLDRWEYRVEIVAQDVTHDPLTHGRRIQAYLNELGEDGWELVAITGRSLYQREYTDCTLKRRLVE